MGPPRGLRLLALAAALAGCPPLLGAADIPSERACIRRGTMEVKVGIFLEQVISIEPSQFRAVVARLVSFSDPAVAADANGTEVRVLPLTVARRKYWDPALHFVNVNPAGDTEVLEDRFEAQPNGRVTIFERVVATFSNRLDLSLFPFDQQDLQVQVAPRICGADEVRLLAWAAESGASDFPLGIVRLFDKEAVSIAARTSILGARFRVSQVVFTMSVSRSAGVFVKHFLVPSNFFVIASWTTFWMPPAQFVPRVATSWLAMLAWVTFKATVVSYGLPMSKHEHLVDVMTLNMTVLLFLVVVQNVVVYALKSMASPRLAVKLDVVSRIMFPGFLFILWLAFLITIADLKGLRDKTDEERGSTFSAIEGTMAAFFIIGFASSLCGTVYLILTQHKKLQREFIQASGPLAIDPLEIAPLFHSVGGQDQDYVEVDQIEERLKEDGILDDLLRQRVLRTFKERVSDPHCIDKDEFCKVWGLLTRGRLEEQRRKKAAGVMLGDEADGRNGLESPNGSRSGSPVSSLGKLISRLPLGASGSNPGTPSSSQGKVTSSRSPAGAGSNPGSPAAASVGRSVAEEVPTYD